MLPSEWLAPSFGPQPTARRQVLESLPSQRNTGRPVTDGRTSASDRVGPLLLGVMGQPGAVPGHGWQGGRFNILAKRRRRSSHSREIYCTPLATRAGRNSSPARQVGSFGAFATLTPIMNPNRAYCSIPEKSQSSLYSSDG